VGSSHLITTHSKEKNMNKYTHMTLNEAAALTIATSDVDIDNMLMYWTPAPATWVPGGSMDMHDDDIDEAINELIINNSR
jgi:hypothetical protein